MYRAYTQDGTDKIMIFERPQWVKVQKNGVMINCTEADAQGVVIDGEAYHVDGKPKMDAPTVILGWQDDLTEMLRAADDAQLVSSITFAILAEADMIDPVTMGEHPDQFLPWVPGVDFKAGNIRRYPPNGKLYRCRQDHRSQADWTPDATPALWGEIADPAEEWSKWVQPYAPADYYQVGAKCASVDHGTPADTTVYHWINQQPNNTYPPGVWGWTKAVAG